MGRWYESANEIFTGVHEIPAGDTNPRILATDYICRRVMIVANTGDTVVIMPQGQPPDVGFPLPAINATGGFSPVIMDVNNVNLVWIAGAAGGETVYWIAER